MIFFCLVGLLVFLLVGGQGDPGETDPLAIALREARDETGLTDLTPWPDASLRHLVIVDVPASASKGEPAHEHADLRFVFATKRPDAIEPENSKAALRWLTLAEANKTTSEDNLRETLRRAFPAAEPQPESDISDSRRDGFAALQPDI